MVKIQYHIEQRPAHAGSCTLRNHFRYNVNRPVWSEVVTRRSDNACHLLSKQVRYEKSNAAGSRWIGLRISINNNNITNGTKECEMRGITCFYERFQVLEDYIQRCRYKVINSNEYSFLWAKSARQLGNELNDNSINENTCSCSGGKKLSERGVAIAAATGPQMIFCCIEWTRCHRIGRKQFTISWSKLFTINWIAGWCHAPISGE